MRQVTAGLDAEELSAVRGHTAAVLALLTLAHLQPDRFEGGWITVEALARYTTIGANLPNVRRALDRARLILGMTPLKLDSDTRSRKSFVRLLPPIPSVLLKWFQDLGKSYLLPGAGEAAAFSVVGVGGERHTSDAMSEALHSTLPLKRLKAHLDEVASRTTGPDPSASEWIHEARLLLATTEVVLVGSGADHVRALRSALESHLTRMSVEGPHDLVIAEGQCAIALARCALRSALLAHPTWPIDEAQVTECREWLSRAAAILPSLPLQERGHQAILEAAMTLHDASARRVSWDWACENIEAHLAHATEHFRLARDTPGLVDILVLRAEMVFHKFIGDPEWPDPVHYHETATALAILRGYTELAKRPDAWVIGGVRAVMLRIGDAVQGYRGDERALTAAALDKAAREVISLGVLATESTLPYVAHAREILSREAASLKIELPAMS